jgi:hypothetical protein
VFYVLIVRRDILCFLRLSVNRVVMENIKSVEVVLGAIVSIG